MQDKKVSDAQERIRFVFKWDSRFRSWTTSTIHHFRQLNRMLLFGWPPAKFASGGEEKSGEGAVKQTQAQREEKKNRTIVDSHRKIVESISHKTLTIDASPALFIGVWICAVISLLRFTMMKLMPFVQEIRKEEIWAVCDWPLTHTSIRMPLSVSADHFIATACYFFRSLRCISFFFFFLFSMAGSAFGWVHISRRIELLVVRGALKVFILSLLQRYLDERANRYFYYFMWCGIKIKTYFAFYSPRRYRWIGYAL